MTKTILKLSSVFILITALMLAKVYFSIDGFDNITAREYATLVLHLGIANVIFLLYYIWQINKLKPLLKHTKPLISIAVFVVDLLILFILLRITLRVPFAFIGGYLALFFAMLYFVKKYFSAK